MTISLSVAEILADIKSKSHYEVSAITDPETRYRVEAGTEKEKELFRSILEVASTLSHRLRRFLAEDYLEEAGDGLAVPEAIVYDFVVSDRRAANIAQPLADAMHEYIVHYAMAKFYATVSQGDLSNAHSTLTAAAAERINEIIYTKQPPML